jgi:hypothetical protein
MLQKFEVNNGCEGFEERTTFSIETSSYSE